MCSVWWGANEGKKEMNPAGVVGLLTIEFERGSRWSSRRMTAGKSPRLLKGWNTAGFDASKWVAAK